MKRLAVPNPNKSELIRILSGKFLYKKQELCGLGPHKPGERGQALAETALFSTLAVVMAFAILALIPVHRARTVATSAAYACAQFLSQSPRPSTAVYNAYRVATETLEADWSATLGMEYNLEIVPPSGSGQPGGCAVHYRPPIFFNGLLGLQGPQWSSEWFVSRSETWKAKW